MKLAGSRDVSWSALQRGSRETLKQQKLTDSLTKLYRANRCRIPNESASSYNARTLRESSVERILTRRLNHSKRRRAWICGNVCSGRSRRSQDVLHNENQTAKRRMTRADGRVSRGLSKEEKYRRAVLGTLPEKTQPRSRE